MTKRHKPLRDLRLSDAYLFVRYTREVIRAYHDDRDYMPSKSDLDQFRHIKRHLASACQFAAEIEQRMEGRREGRIEGRDHKTSARQD